MYPPRIMHIRFTVLIKCSKLFAIQSIAVNCNFGYSHTVSANVYVEVVRLKIRPGECYFICIIISHTRNSGG